MFQNKMTKICYDSLYCKPLDCPRISSISVKALGVKSSTMFNELLLPFHDV